MPIYEFSCLNCGEIFEKLVLKNEEEQELKCPYCRSQNIKKLISSFYSNKDSSLKSHSCSGSGFGFT
uniref:Zinc ribbon domain-containing protein n=1 Tax=Thermodesulfobacterium geofontis TaxID=1295609 RepID=A0A7V5XF73_9BACT